MTTHAIDLGFDDTGSGAPVVLLHGLGSSARDWELQVPELARSHRVIVPDLRGHGRSPRPPGAYTMALLADDVARLLRKLDVKGAHVVGISLGGMVAFQLALDAPELVGSLVIINSGPEVVPRTLREKAALYVRYPLLRLFGLAGLGKRVAARLFPKPAQEALRRQFVERVSEMDEDAYRKTMGAIIGWTVSARVSSIACPILVVSGDRDYTPVSAKEAYLPLLRDAKLVVVEDSGHASPMDQPAAVNRLVIDFLERVAPSRATTRS